MAKFPEYTDIAFLAPIVEEIQHKTLVSSFDNLGVEKRRRKWLYPRRMITIQYENIKWDDAETLWQFYLARQGRYDPFDFFLRTTRTYVGEYIDTGDGSTTIFNMPYKASSARTTYMNGAIQSESSSINYDAGAGANGADKMTWASAPSDGAILTGDFTGILKIRCRFAEDIYNAQMFYGLLVTTGVRLQGLLNA